MNNPRRVNEQASKLIACKVQATGVRAAFEDLIELASERGLSVSFATDLRDADGSPSSGSYFEPALRQIQLPTERNGERRSWDELLCVLAHELGHEQDRIRGDGQLARERRAWEWARRHLEGMPVWDSISVTFATVSEMSLKAYEALETAESRS